jgi:hypothetical protein
MAAKESVNPPATPKSDPKVVKLRKGENGTTMNMTHSEAYAHLTAHSFLTAQTMQSYSGFDPTALDITDMVGELKKAGDEVVRGDLGRIERTLTSQFLTLDTIFGNLAELSKRQEYMKQMETYLRLALKAQAQARATAEALALLKNPQPYIKQANIANGPQQVNNGQSAVAAPTHAGIFQSSPNKLLEAQDANILDTRAPTAAGRVNQRVEALG